ncbi:hypothetical protein HK105_201575 [Polyrhizophydium stewartii]|uniref:SCP domain-containing protein n=1 Tax=Polyrhizophydium stewartii TaxID=2732419 RepID=A0ABR4NGU9_9FUNG|nr:hypothetical protein HK105_008059 [Polyrhizophydium stewartii]
MHFTSLLLAFAATTAVSADEDRAESLVMLQKRIDVSQRNACFLSSRASATALALGSPNGSSSISSSSTTKSAVAATSAAPKPTQAAPAPNTGGSSFLARCVNRMNYYRSRHGRPGFRIDAALTARAQSWANSCTWSHNSRGQSMWSGTEQDCVAAVDAWYAEIRLLTPGRTYMIDSIWQTVGHLTQLLDTHSTAAGCGVGCKTVCDFDPFGNVIGTTFKI